MTENDIERVHAESPCLCSSCRDGILERIERGEAIDWIYCPHNQTLALLKRDNGCVLEWHLIGPIDQGEAVRRLRDVAATRAKEYAEAVDPVSRVDLSKMNG